ncbi:MAG TPA: DUF4249 domain-containing protein [Flavobacterium sp.]|uniref:DUF4249 domain-containing protein n=1 Tax=Flavobacterium sp. TaxID=239 RepID=UPI002F3E494A
MKKLYFNKITPLLLLIFITAGCTEQYVIQTNTFEEALVVEATITNELKKQQIKISKTYRFEENGPTFESGVEVFITDDTGNKFEFEEQSDIYISKLEFKAVPDRKYQLHIITNDGRSYTSSTEILPTENKIESIIPTVETIEGQRGVQINVNSYDPSRTSKYYRYEYEETYKIIAPRWVYQKAVVTGPQEVSIVPRTEEAHTCYGTKNSNDIILTNTAGSNEDRVHFPVRFISNQDYIITHRYSILVRQYVQSLAAHTYYKTLKKISASGSILSPTQPGFFYGNLRSEDNPNEKIIGFFEVSSVSSKRMFFNYADLFPREHLPPYYTECEQIPLRFCFGPSESCRGDDIIDYINSNTLVLYYRDYLTNVYYLFPTPCGDCSSFSSNIKPLFWEN